MSYKFGMIYLNPFIDHHHAYTSTPTGTPQGTCTPFRWAFPQVPLLVFLLPPDPGLDPVELTCILLNDPHCKKMVILY